MLRFGPNSLALAEFYARLRAASPAQLKAFTEACTHNKKVDFIFAGLYFRRLAREQERGEFWAPARSQAYGDTGQLDCDPRWLP